MNNNVLSHYLGFRLTSEYVFKALSTTSVIECAFRCLNEECCASITYRVSSKDHKKNCHLNIQSLNYPEYLLRDEHANYYEFFYSNKVYTLYICN